MNLTRRLGRWLGVKPGFRRSRRSNRGCLPRIEEFERRVLLAGESSLASIAAGRLDLDPLSFQPNVGQASRDVAFLAHGLDYSLRLSPSGALVTLLSSPESERPIEDRDLIEFSTGDPSAVSASIGIDWVGASEEAAAVGIGLMPNVSNYLVGFDQDNWHTAVPHYREVRFDEVYPGIDLQYHGRKGHLEYDWVVQPGADPAQIEMRIRGAEDTMIDGQGRLVITTEWGDLVQEAPVVYQELQEGLVQIDGEFELHEDGTVGFALGVFDPASTLVIDPVLVLETYLGGGGYNRANAVALDDEGNIYVAGRTEFVAFVTTPGALQQVKHGGLDGPSAADAFITKMSPTGEILFSTFLGGSDDDSASGIGVDLEGNVYVGGYTLSNDFPLKDAVQLGPGGNLLDGFVAKLSPDGSELVYSTYLGGPEIDGVTDIAVDLVGNVHAVGLTHGQFPTYLPLLPPGGVDAFLARFDPTGAIDFATTLGGEKQDFADAVALDADGNVVVVGTTASLSFPVVNQLDKASTDPSDLDAFVSIVSSYGDELIYSTRLGGSRSIPTIVDGIPGTVIKTDYGWGRQRRWHRSAYGWHRNHRLSHDAERCYSDSKPGAGDFRATGRGSRFSHPLGPVPCRK